MVKNANAKNGFYTHSTGLCWIRRILAALHRVGVTASIVLLYEKSTQGTQELAHNSAKPVHPCINVNITTGTMLKFDANVNIDAQCERTFR